ncbi:MAG TPA: hypothetical protein DCG12_18750 [Planctomycetaceae bacterium]|nr:hypothetical protein [Planctomycetaceae bacterium]
MRQPVPIRSAEKVDLLSEFYQPVRHLPTAVWSEYLHFGFQGSGRCRSPHDSANFIVELVS